MRLFAIPSRCYFRMKKFGFNLTVSFAHIQTLEGTTSLLPNGRHIILWDIENCTPKEKDESLRKVQVSYSLPHIYTVSDIERSYRAYSFLQVDFKTLFRILLNTKYVDPIFLDYTFRRKKATLRVSQKRDRPKQKIVSILESYYVPIPKDKAEKVIYDTGIEKTGISIILGGE